LDLVEGIELLVAGIDSTAEVVDTAALFLFFFAMIVVL